MADTTIKQIKVGTTTYDIGANMTLASSTGTSAITLAASSKYQISAGGNTIIFTTPADNNTATAADNILDGSNSGTQITYAPYSSTTATSTWVGTDGNAGKFYLGTVNPAKSTRLNYNGYLYATKLYSNNTEVSVVGHTHTPSEVGAASSDIYPNNSGEIKSKYRIALKGYTGSGNPVWYYKLIRLPIDNDGNYASAIINGRIGGWTAGAMSSIYCLVWNRSGIGLALLDIGGTGAMSTIFDRADLVVYKNSDNTADIYIKCKEYFTFDLDVEVFQSSASITYDGTYIATTPSGTEGGKASTSTSRIQLEQGVLKVNGTAVSLSGHTHNYAGSSSAGGAATSANKLNTNAGSGTQPVYFTNGVPTATTYALNKTVPSDAVFTDTKNTAGTSNQAATKLFLVGATEQSANPQTHSNANVYIGTNNKLYSNAKEVVTTDDSRLSDARTPKSHSHTFSGSIANNVIGTYDSTTGELDLTVTTSTISGNTGN